MVYFTLHAIIQIKDDINKYKDNPCIKFPLVLILVQIP